VWSAVIVCVYVVIIVIFWIWWVQSNSSEISILIPWFGVLILWEFHVHRWWLTLTVASSCSLHLCAYNCCLIFRFASVMLNVTTYISCNHAGRTYSCCAGRKNFSMFVIWLCIRHVIDARWGCLWHLPCRVVASTQSFKYQYKYQYLSLKYQYQYQYPCLKYKYKYQYFSSKYQYQYKYLKMVLKYRSSTSTSTQYYNPATLFASLWQWCLLQLVAFCVVWNILLNYVLL